MSGTFHTLSVDVSQLHRANGTADWTTGVSARKSSPGWRAPGVGWPSSGRNGRGSGVEGEIIEEAWLASIHSTSDSTRAGQGTHATKARWIARGDPFHLPPLPIISRVQ
jgi:hypothetical protein